MTEQLRRRIDGINRDRMFGAPMSRDADGVEVLFCPSTKLFVYGTLRPGAPNHHLLDDITGEWIEATTRGHLSDKGWGATDGYPAITLDPAGANVTGVILVSPELSNHWTRLDEFEGDAYCRLLTLAQREDGVQDVVNVYALRDLERKLHGP